MSTIAERTVEPSLPVVSTQPVLKESLETMPVITPQLSSFDIHLLKQGQHYRLYDKLGAHPTVENGVSGVRFSLWAPNAHYVSVMGSFNEWQRHDFPMEQVQASGFWSVFIPGVKNGASYKYYIQSAASMYEVEKADPVGFYAELRPSTGSRVWDMDGYQWQDQGWMAQRKHHNHVNAPISIYEVHLGSWMRVPEDNNRWMTYRELAHKLAEYAKDMNYTHVELMPVAEHPFDGSWGYQVTGYFAPTSRFGTPDDFKYFVDVLHQHGIGVIVDWVPAHFPKDRHGLDFFDGTNLYEHSDWRKREQLDWGTNLFNYSRWEVRNFLVANALFWLDKYHIDGLRVDAVASMLYLDYSKKDGEWVANEYGGRENIDAIHFLREFNEKVYGHFPDTMTFAEESTSFGGMTKPTEWGGLGFGFKWDMGWMHDTLKFMSMDSVYRKHHQNDITFRGLYMFSENFTLPLSHDEVVHGKQALLAKMPGDDWQKFANLRALLGYMFAQPGKKLLFMGCDIGQWSEWSEATSLDWHLLDWGNHRGIQHLVRELNRLYKEQPALHQKDCDPAGFYMIDCQDNERSIMSFARRTGNPAEDVIVVCNFTPAVQHGYYVGVPEPGTYVELLNTDDRQFDGSGQTNPHPVQTGEQWVQNQPHYLSLTLPPLGVTILRRQ
jgi:1,4-alpha-glucan branching enzyme